MKRRSMKERQARKSMVRTSEGTEDLRYKRKENEPDRICVKSSTGILGMIPTAPRLSRALFPAKRLGADDYGAETGLWSLLSLIPASNLL